MRMWMVAPSLLCRKHLLGEHGELHKHLHNWRKRHRIDGRIAGNAIEPRAYKRRHDALAREMLRRGYRHNSPLAQPDFTYLPRAQQLATVDQAAALALLLERCEHCAARRGGGE